MRKRKKLEVSTFPFLAVLLCTMGSLILLLLVIDKKAKKAALEKLFLAQKQSTATVPILASKEKELLEKQSSLLEEIETLKKISKKLDAKAALPNKKEWQAYEQTKQKLEALKGKELEKKTAIASLKGQEKALEIEAKAASVALLKLEATLDQLKALKEKEKATYSIIPYSGKKGMDRKPLYLECSASGVVFHPDGKAINPENDPTLLLMEIESRCDQLKAHLEYQLGIKGAVPYLLVLVRPDGIANYWNLQAIIKKMDLDFGYELIDQSWNLEIPNHDFTPQTNLADKGTRKPIYPTPKPLQPSVPPGTLNNSELVKPIAGIPQAPGENQTGFGSKGSPEINGAQNQRNSNGTNTNPTLASNQQGNNGIGNSLNSKAASRYSAGGIQSFPKYGPTEIPGIAGKGNEIRGLDPYAPLAKVGPNEQGRNQPGANVSNSALGTGQTTDRTGDGQSKLFPQGGNPSYSGNTGERINSGDPTNSGFPQNKQFLSNGLNGEKNQELGKSNDFNASNHEPGHQKTAHGISKGQPESKKGTNPSIQGVPTFPSNTSGTPEIQGNQKIDITVNHKKPEQTNPSPPAPSRTTYSPNEDGPPSNTPDAISRVATPLPELGPRKSKTPPPLKAARLFAERDWILFVECRFEGIIIHASKKFFPTEMLASETGLRSFLAEIQSLIEKKQSTVRPGDPLYRPQVRFLIWADGPRSYHIAYPPLRSAGIWQTAQNLEPEDNVQEILRGGGK